MRLSHIGKVLLSLLRNVDVMCFFFFLKNLAVVTGPSCYFTEVDRLASCHYALVLQARMPIFDCYCYCYCYCYLFFFFSSSIFLLLSYASFHPSHVHIRMQVLQCSFHLLPTSSAPLAKHKDHLFDSLCFSRLKLAPPQWWGACSVVTFAFTSITHKRTASGVGRRFRPRDQRTVDRWTPLLCVRRFSFLAQNVRRSFTGAICGCHVV